MLHHPKPPNQNLPKKPEPKNNKTSLSHRKQSSEAQEGRDQKNKKKKNLKHARNQTARISTHSRNVSPRPNRPCPLALWPVRGTSQPTIKLQLQCCSSSGNGGCNSSSSSSPPPSWKQQLHPQGRPLGSTYPPSRPKQPKQPKQRKHQPPPNQQRPVPKRPPTASGLRNRQLRLDGGHRCHAGKHGSLRPRCARSVQ